MKYPITPNYLAKVPNKLVQIYQDLEEEILNAICEQLNTGEANEIDYESGYHCRVDVAVRRAVMTGITQISAKYTDALMEEVGTDLLEVTAHPGARVS